MKFFVFSLRKILAFFLCLLVGGTTVFFMHKAEVSTNASLLGVTVVLDAGHGGIDGGAESKALKLKESDLNLKIVKRVETHLKRIGVSVVLTRANKDGLYSPVASNKKQSEMQKRKQIIEKADADLVVSVHQNSFNLKSVHGAGAFYQSGNDAGERASKKIAEEISKMPSFENTKTKTANYFILDCTSVPTVLVECCYLTNLNDATFIKDEKNQEKMAYAIFCGIVKYFNIENY